MLNVVSRSDARLLTLAGVLASMSSVCVGQAAPEPILQFDDATVEDYLASPTSAQQSEPMLLHRGVGLDGSLRLQAPFGWQVNGNPFHEEWNDKAWHMGMLLASGRFSPTEIDIALPAPGFSWTVGRTYHIPDEGRAATQGYQGYNWQQFSQPEVVRVDDVGADPAADYIYLVYGADRFLEFKRLDATSSVYRGINGAAGAFVEGSDGIHDLLTYWDQHGTRSTFFDPADADNIQSSDDAQGQLWTIEDTAGNIAYVGHQTNPATAITAGYDADARIQEAYDTAGRQYVYTYSTLNEIGGSGTGSFLTKVEAFVPDGAGWDTTGVSVSYTYGLEEVDNRYTFGDLLEAKATIPLTDFDPEQPTEKIVERRHQYLYDDGDSSTATHWLTAFFSPEGVRRFAEDNGSITPIDTTTGSFFGYADMEFVDHYNVRSYVTPYLKGRIKNFRYSGSPRFSAGGGSVTEDVTQVQYFHYTTFSETNGYQPDHAFFTTVNPKNRDGSVRFNQYFDEAGQPLTYGLNAEIPEISSSFYEYTPSLPEEPTFWTAVTRDASSIPSGVDGVVNLVGMPNSVQSGTVNPDSGAYRDPCVLYGTPSGDVRHLVYTYPRDTGTGSAFFGFRESWSFQNGNTPWQSIDGDTPFKDLPNPFFEYDYLTPARNSAAAAEVDGEYLVIRPLFAKVREVQEVDFNAQTLTINETVFAYEFHAESLGGGGSTNADDPNWLRPRRTTTTLPAVSAAKLGSGVSPTRETYRREDGTLAFAKDEVDSFNYYSYENNLLVKSIEDVDLSSSASFPAGDGPSDFMASVPSTAGAFDLVTDMVRDEIGRTTSTTIPTGRIKLARYDSLSNGDVTHVQSAKSAGSTHYGPAMYRAYNHNGDMVFDGEISFGSTSMTSSPLSGWIDDTQDNAFSGLAVGEVGSARSYMYDDSGSVLWSSRLYHTMPVSGEGVRFYNFDEEIYTYDVGRKVGAVAEMNGTMRSTRFDPYGEALEITIDRYDPSEGITPPAGQSSQGGFVFVPGWTPSEDCPEECCVPGTSEDGVSGGFCGTFGQLPDDPVIIDPGLDPTRDGSNKDGADFYQIGLRGETVFQYNPKSPHYFLEYDNQGRLIREAEYASVPTSFGEITIFTFDRRGDPALFSAFDDRFQSPYSEASGRRSLREYEYNERGWVSRIRTYNINQSDGQVEWSGGSEEFVETVYAYDPVGRVIYANDGRPTKIVRDRLGREVTRYEISISDDQLTDYSDFEDADNDLVVEQTQLVRVPENGNVTHVVRVDRFDPVGGGSEPFGSKDQNDYSDPSSFVVNPSLLDGRAQITEYEYDVLDRVISRIEHGAALTAITTTNSTAVTFDPQNPPAGALATTLTRDGSGRVVEITDPLGRVQQRTYDLAGKLTETVDNFDSTTAATATNDMNRRIGYRYENTQLVEYIAYDDANSMEPDQAQRTLYEWERDHNFAEDSSRDRVTKITYPDGKHEEFVYDIHGTLARFRDRAGNWIEIDLDVALRPRTLNFSTIVGNDFVQSAGDKIMIEYTDRGQIKSLTQTSGLSTAWTRDTVDYEYDGYGNLKNFEQDVPWFRDVTNGPGISSVEARSFGYTWERSSVTGPSHIRLGSNRYPHQVDVPGDGLDGSGGSINPLLDDGDGSLLSYSYSGAINSPLSRVSSVNLDGTNVASYSYLGMNRIAKTTYGENSVYSTLRNAAGDFDALDRFNRITRSRWNRTRPVANAANEVPFYDTTVAWDDGSNVTGVTDHVFDSDFNFVYTNDQLDRLTKVERGDGDGTSITSLLGQEEWTLSKVGNWDEYNLDLNGDLDYSDQDLLSDTVSRRDDESKASGTFSSINEQTGLDLDTNNTAGAEESFTREYDANGNLIVDPAKKHRYKWDVLGRLVEVYDTSDSAGDELIAEFMYNAMNYRIAEHTDTDDDGDVDTDDKWTRFIYDARWRVIAAYEVEGGTVNTETLRERHVHHAAGFDGLGTASYIDEVVLRDNDADADGVLEERHYYCQSWRMDVVAIIDAAGNQVEQMRYSAYGVPTALPIADTNRDGLLNFFDINSIGAAISGPYDVKLDMDLNGELNFFDVAAIIAQYNHLTTNAKIGRGVLSSYGHNRGYAGYWRDQYNGLVYVRHRWYSDEQGVWLSPDPLRYIDGPNLYGYTVQSPLIYTDPLGLQPYNPWDEAIEEVTGMDPDGNDSQRGGRHNTSLRSRIDDDEMSDTIDDMSTLAEIGVRATPAGVISTNPTRVAKKVAQNTVKTVAKRKNWVQRAWKWWFVDGYCGLTR